MPPDMLRLRELLQDSSISYGLRETDRSQFYREIIDYSNPGLQEHIGRLYATTTGLDSARPTERWRAARVGVLRLSGQARRETWGEVSVGDLDEVNVDPVLPLIPYMRQGHEAPDTNDLQRGITFTVYRPPNGDPTLHLHGGTQPRRIDEATFPAELIRTLCALHDWGYDQSESPIDPNPEILDRLDGVIREISGSKVMVSLFDDDDEYGHEFSEELFTKNGVAVRVGEGFHFWVERFGPDTERMVVRPLERKQLTESDLRRIRAEVKKTIEGK